MLHFALRDEIVNIHAMTRGGLPNKYSHQIFICKRKPILNKEGIPFLLDPKKTKALYSLSNTGKWYFDKVKNDYLPLKYVAFIDLQIEIRPNLKMFTDLNENNFFSVWSPTAPVDFYENNDSGYLVVFRVYNLKREVEQSLLFKGRAGRKFYYGLTEDQSYELCDPVIENGTFDKMKQDLLSLLKANGSFIGQQ